MTLWSSKDAEKATRGFSTQHWRARGICLDPAQVKPGDLFFCMPEMPFEALTQAFGKGAAAAVVSIWPEGMDKTHPLLIVEDPLAALHRMAVAGLKRCGARRLGVTGGPPRTGLAEMMGTALDTLGQTQVISVSAGGCDGLMLSLARLPAGADYLIFDMDKECQADIKTDMVLTAVQDFDDISGVTLKAYLEAANGTRLRAEIEGENVSLTLPLPGRQVALNALCALQAVKALGGNVKKAAQALASSQKRKEHAPGQGPVTLMEDARSISCGPAKKAFKVLAMVDPGRGHKRIAILSHLHDAANDSLSKETADWFLPTQTKDVNLVYTRTPLLGRACDKNISLQKIVPDVLAPGDVLMLKGANTSGHGIIVEALRVPRGE